MSVSDAPWHIILFNYNSDMCQEIALICRISGVRFQTLSTGYIVDQYQQTKSTPIFYIQHASTGPLLLVLLYTHNGGSKAGQLAARSINEEKLFDEFRFMSVHMCLFV